MKFLLRLTAIVASPFTLGLIVTFLMIYVTTDYHYARDSYQLKKEYKDLDGSLEKAILMFFDRIHEMSVDLRFRLRGERPGIDRVAILTIDEKSLEEIGRWPWPRSVIAEAVDRVIEGGASAIGFDIVFAEEDKNSAVPVLKRLRRDLHGKHELTPRVSKMLSDEIDKANSDKYFAKILAKHADRIVMGTYFDNPEIGGLRPFREICLARNFSRSTNYAFWEDQVESRAAVLVDDELAIPEGMLERLDAQFDEYEKSELQAWWFGYSRAIDFQDWLNRELGKEIDEELRWKILGRWLERDTSGIRNIVQKENPALQANSKEMDEFVDSFFTWLPDTERVPLYVAINRKQNDYCSVWLNLSDKDSGGQDPNIDKLKEEWALITEDEDDFKGLPFEAAIEYIKFEALGNMIKRTGRWWTNIPILNDATKHAAFFNAEQDSDGTIRRAMLMARSADTFALSLPMRLFLVDQALNIYSDVKAELGFTHRTVHTMKLQNQDGEDVFDLPVDRGGRLMINYAGPRHMFPYLSVSDLLSNREEVEIAHKVYHSGSDRLVSDKRTVNLKEFLKDKIFIFGATATGIFDLRVTPFEENFPGVETHANVLDNLLRLDFLYLHPQEAEIMAAVMLVLGILLTFFVGRFSALIGFMTTAIVVVGLFFFDRYYLFEKGVVSTIVFPVSLVIGLFMVLTFYKYLTEERKKKELKGTFGKYVSPAIVEEILKDPDNVELGGRKEQLTVFFSDIRGFTTISEKLDPGALSDLLNSYLTPMTELVFNTKGTLDKYMGDAIMAFWGAPITDKEHAKHACRCALQSIEKLHELQAEYKRKGLPSIDIGIGLNTGEMSVGNMGSEIVRSYTVMGDAVNLGSRLEGINKQYGTRIIMSEFTHNHVKDDFVSREIDWVRVKGKALPVKIFELVSESKAPGVMVETLKWFNEGFVHYHEKKFQQAIECFSQALNANPNDTVSKLYVQRCSDYKTTPPPEDWDGVFVMTTK